MTRRLPRKAVSVVVAVMLAVVAGYALYWYAPWTLVIDTTVNDALTSGFAPNESSAAKPNPTHTEAGQPYRILSGTFISQQHKTSGTARVIRVVGRLYYSGFRLELADLDTSNGPDLQVWLSDQPVTAEKSGWQVFDTGRWVELGDLKGNKGNQTYDIPADVDLSTVRSVTIWSGRFSVSYGAAALS
jgi:hypothetical protein